MTERIEPCPWCDRESKPSLRVEQPVRDYGDPGAQVSHECCAMSPWYESREDAIEAWNAIARKVAAHDDLVAALQDAHADAKLELDEWVHDCEYREGLAAKVERYAAALAKARGETEASQ